MAARREQSAYAWPRLIRYVVVLERDAQRDVAIVIRQETRRHATSGEVRSYEGTNRKHAHADACPGMDGIVFAPVTAALPGNRLSSHSSEGVTTEFRFLPDSTSGGKRLPRPGGDSLLSQ